MAVVERRWDGWFKGELSLDEVAVMKLEMALLLAVRRGRKRGSQKSHRYTCD